MGIFVPKWPTSPRYEPSDWSGLVWLEPVEDKVEIISDGQRRLYFHLTLGDDCVYGSVVLPAAVYTYMRHSQCMPAFGVDLDFGGSAEIVHIIIKNTEYSVEGLE